MNEKVRSIMTEYLKQHSWIQVYGGICDELIIDTLRYQENEVSCKEVDRRACFDQRIFIKEFEFENGEKFCIKYKDAISHFDTQFDISGIQLLSKDEITSK